MDEKRRVEIDESDGLSRADDDGGRGVMIESKVMTKGRVEFRVRLRDHLKELTK